MSGPHIFPLSEAVRKVYNYRAGFAVVLVFQSAAGRAGSPRANPLPHGPHWRSGNENNSETFSTVVRWPTDWIAECGPRRSIARQPLGNPGAWRFENFRQFATGPAFGIQNYGLHPFRHAIGTIPLRFLAQDNQSMIRLRTQSQHARNHGYSSTRSMPHLPGMMSFYLCAVVYQSGH